VSEQAAARILVIDDDPALQKLVISLLRRAGFEGIPASDVYEAEAVLAEEPYPALILLDLMLPEVSGIEILARIRARRELDPLPVVILSALADPEQIKEGLDGGADRYLTKPYLANNLVSTVRELLETGRKH
jgi:two-component system, OmpR family, phosphate regulon response regulator PhoB